MTRHLTGRRPGGCLRPAPSRDRGPRFDLGAETANVTFVEYMFVCVLPCPYAHTNNKTAKVMVQVRGMYTFPAVSDHPSSYGLRQGLGPD